MRPSDSAIAGAWPGPRPLSTNAPFIQSSTANWEKLARSSWPSGVSCTAPCATSPAACSDSRLILTGVPNSPCTSSAPVCAGRNSQPSCGTDSPKPCSCEDSKKLGGWPGVKFTLISACADPLIAPGGRPMRKVSTNSGPRVICPLSVLPRAPGPMGLRHSAVTGTAPTCPGPEIASWRSCRSICSCGACTTSPGTKTSERISRATPCSDSTISSAGRFFCSRRSIVPPRRSWPVARSGDRPAFCKN